MSTPRTPEEREEHRAVRAVMIEILKEIRAQMDEIIARQSGSPSPQPPASDTLQSLSAPVPLEQAYQDLAAPVNISVAGGLGGLAEGLVSSADSDSPTPAGQDGKEGA